MGGFWAALGRLSLYTGIKDKSQDTLEYRSRREPATTADACIHVLGYRFVRLL